MQALNMARKTALTEGERQRQLDGVGTAECASM